jgi:hypothetical protein
MFIKMLPKIHLATCEKIADYARELKQEKIKKLDLSSVPFTSMSEKQLQALAAMIVHAEIETLILKENNFGKLKLEQLNAFCTHLEGAKLNKWRIDNNGLNLLSFSYSHWVVLHNTIMKLPLSILSLQDNSLMDLQDKEFMLLKNISQHIERCLLTKNNWEYERWTQLIVLPENDERFTFSAP